jgi:hypothetical protein
MKAIPTPEQLGRPRRSAPSAQASRAALALAIAAFALAAAISYRDMRLPGSTTLRTPGVLLLDAALAMAIALGYGVRQGTLAGAVGAGRCFAFGLWSAAVFRLIPRLPMEDIIYESNAYSADVPFILMGIVLHGGIAAVLAWPFARRVLDSEGRGGRDDEGVWYLSGAAVLTFFVIAAVARLLAELG